MSCYTDEGYEASDYELERRRNQEKERKRLIARKPGSRVCGHGDWMTGCICCRETKALRAENAGYASLSVGF